MIKFYEISEKINKKANMTIGEILNISIFNIVNIYVLKCKFKDF